MAKAQHSKGSRLGTRFRGKLAQAYGKRGHGLSSLTYAFSPKTSRDWILDGDLEFDHFVLVESDCSLIGADYSPVEQQQNAVFDDVRIPVSAIVTCADGEIEWRVLRRVADLEIRPDLISAFQEHKALLQFLGIRYRMLTDEEIRACPMLLANWRRILVWIAAARDISLVPARERLNRLLQQVKALTLGEIQNHFGDAEFPLIAAALFRQLQQGLVNADLDESPLCSGTIFSVDGKLS